MKVVIAIDSFKGSASSKEINSAISKGLKGVLPEIETVLFPVADGGEGTIEALDSLEEKDQEQEEPRQRHVVQVFDLYQKGTILAQYGLINEQTAVVEVAQSSGIQLIEEEESYTAVSSYGLGEVLKAIVEENTTLSDIWIGLGGSAVNDAGIGMMQALGVDFLTESGVKISKPLDLNEIPLIQSVDQTNLNQKLKDITITLLTDVTNPLTGESGATYTFGPQKGVEDLDQVDDWLKHYNTILKQTFHTDYGQEIGSGAAGGIGLSLRYFYGAKVTAGATFILNQIGLEPAISGADLVITGEGKIDQQTHYGKLPAIVAQSAQKYGVPVIAVAGTLSDEFELEENWNSESSNEKTRFDLAISLCRHPMTLEEAMRDCESLAIEAGKTIGHVLKLAGRLK